MRRSILALVAAVIAALAAVSGAGAGSLASNHRAARRDAPSLLAKLDLPPGAIRLSTEPAGDNGYLKPMESLEADSVRVGVHRWWEMPGTPAAEMAYVRAHPPAGAQLVGTGTGGNRRTGTSEESLDYRWSGVPAVLGDRELVVTATALPNDETGVLAQAQSDWIVPRPKSERIPGSTRLVQITSGLLDAKSTAALSVTDAAQVRRIVGVINVLPIAQPVVSACPALTDPRLITVTFRGARRGPALAVLAYADYRPGPGPARFARPST